MAPNFKAFHQSVTKEIDAIKDRTRHLIGLSHLPTDGSYKEVMLRRILKRSLPDTVRCGTGFVVSDTMNSKQIDILIIDNRRPRLFEDEGLYIVTPDCVIAAIEVKTKTDKLNEGIEAMATFSQLCRESYNAEPCWTAVYVYDDENIGYKTVLTKLQDESGGNDLRAVNCVAAGPNKFFLYWDKAVNDRAPASNCGLQFWHGYELKELSTTYMIGNILSVISKRHNLTFPEDAYFPEENGKESKRVACMSLQGCYHQY